MMQLLLSVAVFFATSGVFAQNTMFYNRIFGHIHAKPYNTSTSVTGISCGEKLEINTKDKKIETEWESVSFGDKKGYIYMNYLSKVRPSCLQADYPAFFQGLELDLTEIYLWGKLGDHFIEFETGN